MSANVDIVKTMVSQYESELIEVRKEFNNNPNKLTAAVTSFFVTGNLTALPAKISSEFMKRAIVQISPKDFIKSIGFSLVTLLIAVLSPALFLFGFVIFLTKIDSQKKAVSIPPDWTPDSINWNKF